MKPIFILMLGLLAGNLNAATEPSADFYVAPTGSDSGAGTLTDPFATLTQARDAVRKLNKGSDMTVLIRGGCYQLDETVVFGLEDSGKGDSIVTYAAYPNETPVFSAGEKTLGWKKVTRALPGLPEAAQGKVYEADVSGKFYSLFDDEGLLPRARSAGFIPLKGSGRDKLRFPKGALKNWDHVTDVEIAVRPNHAWIVNMLPLVSVDEQAQIAKTSVESTYVMNELHYLPGTDSCWVENAIEELDEPGEWVLNTKTGKLYLWPRGKSPIYAPRLRELIRVEGAVDFEGPTDVPVKNLRFRGLTFMHGDRYSIDNDDAGLQHDWNFLDKDTAMLRLRGTENVSVERCHFLHGGGDALRVDLHGQRNTISDNVVEHIGGAGIMLCGYGPGTKDVNKNNLVYNNHVHHVGEIYWHAAGIMVWQSGENRVANNLIHHTPYTSLIISGCMTEFFGKRGAGRELGRTLRQHEIGKMPKRPTIEQVRPFLHTRDNVFEYNEIHHAMERLGDGNAIYIRGAGPNNVIRRNYIHHLVAPMIMQCAIRTDGGQMDTLIAENIIYKCTSQGIMVKLNNRCENNIVADIIAPPRGYYLVLREGPMTGATLKRNILYASGKVSKFISQMNPGGEKTEDHRGRVIARAKDTDCDFNIYYGKSNPDLARKTLTQNRKEGLDANSVAGNPLFVDPENGDFRFKPNSPALKMGIVPIDQSLIGLRPIER